MQITHLQEMMQVSNLNYITKCNVEQIIRALLDSGDLERIERGGYPCIKLSRQGEKRLYDL